MLNSENAIYLLTAGLMLVVMRVLGALLVPGFRHRIACPLAREALLTGWGLLFVTGVAAVVVSRRFCLGGLVPVLQLAVMAALWRGKRPGDSSAAPATPWAALLITWLAVCAWVFAYFEWKDGEGLRMLHSDQGFWSRLVMSLPEAGVSNGWAATLGEHTTSVGLHDTWYHWGSIWLAGFTGMLTGLPPLALLLKITGAVMAMVMVMLSASLVRLIAGTSIGVSLFGGAAALVAVQWIKMYGVLWLEAWLPYGTLQHSRMSVLAYQGYHLEGVLILMVLATWQMRLGAAAALLVFISGLSAPHNVAVLGVSSGMLLGAGLLMRRADLWKPAAVAVGLLLLAWGTVKFLFGMDQGMAAGQSLLRPDVMVLWKRFSDGWIDAGCGFVLELLLLPGLLHLIRQPRGEPNDLRAALGWLALCALVGSYLGYHLLRHISDGVHFTVLAHAAIVVPVSIWGLLSAWQKSRGWRGGICLVIVVLSTLMGAHDMWMVTKRHAPMPYSTTALRQVNEALQGRPCGYFAQSDRGWWISKHSTLAAWLESRCVRLNRIESVETDSFSRFYGGSLLEQWLPREPGETDENWSLRLLRRLGGRHVLETPQDLLPEALKPRFRSVAGDETLRLYELIE